MERGSEIWFYIRSRGLFCSTNQNEIGNEKRIRPERWRIGEGSGGSERPEDSDPSGECDDEDGCQGSGEKQFTDAKQPNVSSEAKPSRLPGPSPTKISRKQQNVASSGSGQAVPSPILVATFLIVFQYVLLLCGATVIF
ncbi:Hypothetical predicted protein [Pelobates cultripes]|uniref:Uncharacterized protein n=1 Tax=Pelobates cultripes TaxID=61616 RepID=A0AAD1RBC0_PELCU|nr:Hypothetical predicted protein [Pelobates cultripes]